jgi:hypothetical protein
MAVFKRFLHFYISDKFARILLVSLLITLVVSVLFGFIIGGREFWNGLLAETFGIATTALITLLIVDRFIDYRDELEWASVRNITLAGVAAHLCDALGQVIIYLPIKNFDNQTKILDGRNKPPPVASEGMRGLADELRHMSEPKGEKSLSDLSIEYYEDVKWELTQIQNVLTPRIMSLSKDKELIDKLAKFDNAYRDFYSAILADKQVVIHAAAPALVRFIDASAELYECIRVRWDRSS